MKVMTDSERFSTVRIQNKSIMVQLEPVGTNSLKVSSD